MTFAEQLLWDLNPDILKSFFLYLSSCLTRGQPLNLFKIIIFETGFLIAQTSLETHCVVENEPKVLIFLLPHHHHKGWVYALLRMRLHPCLQVLYQRCVCVQ